MIIVTRSVWDMVTGELVAENTRLYFGPIASLKGASASQKDLAASQAALAKTLTANYNQNFANQQAVLSAVRAVYDPILNAGPSQFGFAKPEETAYRTQASEDTARNYASAATAVRNRMAAQGGGNSLLPSGAEADIEAQIASAAAAAESNKQLDITKAGYAVGRERFDKATNAEMSAAGMYNPLGYAGAASSTTSSAFDMADKIQQENQSIWGTVGGLAGGLLGSIAGPLGTSIGGKLGGMIGGKKNDPFGPGDIGFCWIAQAIYGDNDPRVNIVRSWLTNIYDKTFVGHLIVSLYKKFGKTIARWVKRFTLLRLMFKPLFDVAVRKGLETQCL